MIRILYLLNEFYKYFSIIQAAVIHSEFLYLRASISLHNAATVGNTSSIQITLQASRAQADSAGKLGTSAQPGKALVNQAINMTSQPKVVMTHSLAPVLQQATLAAKGNRGMFLNRDLKHSGMSKPSKP